MSYHWNWGVFAMPVASGEGAYGTWFATAMEVSAGISAVAWVLALSIGVSVGCARSLGPSWARRIATAWVELHRNVPLLIQMFLWFFVIPELLPHAWGLWIKQDMPCKEAAVAAWCLGCFTSARVAEQTRAGLESLSPGQLQAAQALGMGKAQALLQVLLPQALAMMLPALSSEAMSCVKNSSAAFAIGAFDIAFAARQMQEETAAPLEVFIAATCLYVALALLAKLGVACLGRLKSSRRRC